MSKRGVNIYKRKDGRWEGRYAKGRFNGRIQYGSVYAKTYKEAREKLQNISQEVEVTEETSTTNLFSDIALEWLDSSRSQLKVSSIVKYANIINRHLLLAFGNRNISDITRSDVLLFYNKLLIGGDNQLPLSPKTVTSIICVLKDIFYYASQVKQCNTVDLPRISFKQSQHKLRVFSLQEQQILSEYLYNNIDLCNLGILLCLYTGLRVGEICALMWEDVLFDEQAIYIHQTMQRLQNIGGGESKTQILISTPKSECSIRKIPIPYELFKLIENYKFFGNSYFLTGLSDKYIEPRTMQNKFKRVIKNCGIEDANFHALRHTFATRCIELGFDIKSLSEILGHANVNITLNRYVHPSMELKQRNMNKLSQLLAVK